MSSRSGLDAGSPVPHPVGQDASGPAEEIWPNAVERLSSGSTRGGSRHWSQLLTQRRSAAEGTLAHPRQEHPRRFGSAHPHQPRHQARCWRFNLTLRRIRPPSWHRSSGRRPRAKRMSCSGCRPATSLFGPFKSLAEAIDVITQVVNNQIERMVPWPSSESALRISRCRAKRRPTGHDRCGRRRNEQGDPRPDRAAGPEPRPRAGQRGFLPADDPDRSVELMSLLPHPARKTAARLQFTLPRCWPHA